MSKLEKLYEHILMRRSDANIPFETLCSLLKRLGFDKRTKGDHHIFPRMVLMRFLIYNPKKIKENHTKSNKSGM
jgi:hypothetical protein